MTGVYTKTSVVGFDLADVYNATRTPIRGFLSLEESAEPCVSQGKIAKGTHTMLGANNERPGLMGNSALKQTKTARDGGEG